MSFPTAWPNKSRHPKNVEGDFYGNGDCLQCGVPEKWAPDLLAGLSDENQDTYFARQPETIDERLRAYWAIESCCMFSLRYGGRDPDIIRQLGVDYCDHAVPVSQARQASPGVWLWAGLSKWLKRNGRVQ